MNILGLVFSLLLILSYGFYACWDKQTASTRLRSTYVGHQKANRKILNSYQSEVYEDLRSQSNENPKPREPSKEPTKPKQPELNRDCAKINLWPLIQEGREAHPILYELTAKMIHTFYGSFSDEKKFEYHFLDALLATAKLAQQETGSLVLEKLDIEGYQKSYYKMLKGTKSGEGHPPLLDYVKANPSVETLCLFHAHPDLLSVLFNTKVAEKLYAEVHRKDGPVLTQPLIERICAEMHFTSTQPELFALLQLGQPRHEEQKKAFIAQENEVTLRRDFYIKKS